MNAASKKTVTPAKNAIIDTQIMHRRLFPLGYRFNYRVGSLLLNLDDLPSLSRSLRFFSHNRFNLFSLYDRDHGARDGSPLRGWVEKQLRLAGIDLNGGSVRLLCFPRLLGYAFNPLSLYFCYYPDGALCAVLCQVKNTFGEQHGYLLHQAGQPLPAPVRQDHPKQFHVSPFMAMQGLYRFRLSLNDENFAIAIREYQDDALMLIATQHGVLQPLSDNGLLRLFFRQPWAGVKIIALIHWQALKIWLRGAPFFRKPPPPAHEINL